MRVFSQICPLYLLQILLSQLFPKSDNSQGIHSVELVGTLAVLANAVVVVPLALVSASEAIAKSLGISNVDPAGLYHS